ncbi:MAG: BamA/TamA family outer membrane protein [Deltaproteobacteria bacterium]|nr:BamA/TamA family outer membrane protein [Deltaproteobacteria bacterium]
MKKIFFIALILLQSLPARAAVIDPDFDFSTLETEHFYIHYHQGLDEAAEKIRSIAEDTHEKIVKLFQWEPREKTHVVLIDSMDFANGFANAIPYNMVYLFVTPPPIDATIGEYDDWLTMLFVHEYTHVITLDSARGFSKVTRSIFGKTIPVGDIISLILFIYTTPPNELLPRWWLEGVSTWAETEFTTAGRGRSSYYEMILRMAAAEDNLPRVDEINGNRPDWPSGSLPYIFGLRLQKYIADKYGKEVLGKLSMTHAGRAPYFLNGVPKRFFDGKHYVNLYREMTEELMDHQWGQIKRLKEAGLTKERRYAIDGEKVSNPRISRDGKKVAFTLSDPHLHTVLMVMDSDGGNVREVVRRLPSDHSLAWSPDGKKIYFTQAEIYGGFNIYQDIYSYDLENEKLRRRSRGLRLKDIDISPDGRELAAVVNYRGSQNLVIAPLPEDKKKGLIKKGALQKVTAYSLLRLDSPRWSPDGGKIAFLLKGNEGKSSLCIYDRTSSEPAKVFEVNYDLSSLSWSPDGKQIIYSSDERGVYNLFSYSMVDGRKTQLTNLLGGAFHPDLSPHGERVYYSSYRSKGMQIASMEMREKRDKASPLIKPYWKESGSEGSIEGKPLQLSAPNAGNEGGHGGKDIETIVRAARPYSIGKSILPRFWLPAFYGDHDGAVAGALTAGTDVLGYNAYYLQGGYGLGSGENYHHAMYRNDYFYPTFLLQSYSRPLVYSNEWQLDNFYEKEKGASIQISTPLNRLERGISFITGFEWQKKEALSDLVTGTFEGQPVFEGKSNNAFAGIRYGSALKYPYSISREEGIDASLIYKRYSPGTGADFELKAWIYDLSAYRPFPFTSRKVNDVISLSLKGGASSGDDIYQMKFHLGGDPNFSEFPLRGYPARFLSGKNIATASLEYRIPLWYILRGWNTKPFFFDRLHMAGFADAGTVWDDSDSYKWGNIRTGIGLEVRFDMVLGYLLKITPALGVAQGMGHDGETQGYFTIYADL